MITRRSGVASDVIVTTMIVSSSGRGCISRSSRKSSDKNGDRSG